MATIHIQSGKNNIESNKNDSKVHSVPFTIHAECDAQVDKYFETGVKKNQEDGTFTASFRGYPLKGARVELPEGYMGVVLHESIKPETEKEERKFYVVNNFKSFTYWNWGKIPSQADTIRQALDWLEIAEVLHSPLVEE
ncbi:unnamed protein product [Brassicogethes aeneus]|uniref:Uncharacterized protein n=1 Tax=Brassicogethes aeneus TaxID=1431903 RepID=A0A9P0AQK7_BRAAE|nr:unnamed protein product [Brassicogethes aeneus]